MHVQFGPLDDAGWLVGARRIASPNFDARPPGCEIDVLVVHNISLPPGRFGGDGVIELFTNALDPSAHPYYAEVASLRVSAHFFLRRDGELIQFVSCLNRAWHAGASRWRGRERCNDFSVGVELEGTDDQEFTPMQYRILAQLIRLLRARFRLAELVGHSDIAPNRKTDPGPRFDWTLLRRLTDAA